jgi:hypothetical protein
MRALPSLVLLSVFAVALSAATEAGARVDTAGKPLAIDTPGNVHAGDTITLTWRGSAGSADEMELLLSLDGGRHFDVRVSPECDPRRGQWRWRVPNLPSADARLAIRVGDERGERLASVSARFAIVGAEGAPIERRQVHEGSWWSGLDGADGALPASTIDSGSSLRRLSSGHAIALPESAPQVGAAATSAVFVARPASPPDPALSTTTGAARRFRPLRN